MFSYLFTLVMFAALKMSLRCLGITLAIFSLLHKEKHKRHCYNGKKGGYGDKARCIACISFVRTDLNT